MIHICLHVAGAPPTVQIPGLPPEFMQAIMHQVTQQAMAMANAASSGQQGQQSTPPTANVGSGSTPPPMPPYPPQARVVFTRPSFTHRMASPTFTTRGATLNLRAAVPPMMGQQPGQVNEIPMIFLEYSSVNTTRGSSGNLKSCLRS